MAKANEEVTFDEKSGVAFINNELIVIGASDTSKSDIDAIASKYDAEVSQAMEDIKVYKLRFNERKTLSELEDVIEGLNDEVAVANAYVDTVILPDSDEAEAVAPLYPDDPWSTDPGNPAPWDTDAPRDNNWSAEAIHAPQAWSYLSRLETVRVGIIDTMIELSHPDLNVNEAYATLTDVETGTTESGTITNTNIAADDHGTHVAGIIGATWNSQGVSGIVGDKGELYYSCAYNTRDGAVVEEYTTPFNYFRAIKTLVDRDVQAINISQNTNALIGFAASHGNKKAIQYLQLQADAAEALLGQLISAREAEGKKDFVICVSAGNSNSTKFYKSSGATYGFRTSLGNVYSYEGSETGGSLAEYNNFLCLIDDEEVMNRIITVGSVKMIENGSASTRYEYSAFSNVGSRVDIAAPGERVFSSSVGGYVHMDGTSMATPHVTAAAGLVFAANPNLSGEDVKTIVLTSVSGRYYYQDGYCGLLDLEKAVRFGLETKEHSVNRVIGVSATDGLDLCFLVDTTGSMGDDISNAKENMTGILDALAAKTSEYRVALVDYRDFPDRASSYDYAAKVQFPFTNDYDAIVQGINNLELGNGGDSPETVFSGIATALELDWSTTSRKVIIVLGDAPPLDPEPYTNYTYEDILYALYEANVTVDTDRSDSRVIGDGKESLINVFTIGADASSDAIEFFESISEDTGGSYKSASNSSEVSDAITESIDMIEVTELKDAAFGIGEDYSEETVDLYLDGEYLFSYPLDEDGDATVSDLAVGSYDWEISRLHVSGTMDITEEDEAAKVRVNDGTWYDFIYVLWERKRVETIAISVGAVLAIVLIIIASIRIKKALRGRAAKKQQRAEEKAAAAKAAAGERARAVAEAQAKAQAAATARAQAASDAQLKQAKQAAPVTPRFCPKCGNSLEEGARFCGKCGHHL